MNTKRLYQIIEWTVTLSACGYLAWRLATYDDYASLWASLEGMNWTQWAAIGLCIALMPVNMGLEAWRWKTLVPMGWTDAHRQVYYSKMAGLITPWRLGEYPARAVLRGEWKQTISMGIVASATMTAAIVIAGVAAIGGLCLCEETRIAQLLDSRYWIMIVAVLAALALMGAAGWRIGFHFSDMPAGLIGIHIGQSFMRLCCWCIQLALVLYALGVFFHITSFICDLFVYYLLVTITPNVPIAEAGVRGVWAMELFGSVNAALAGVLLWVINSLLPCVVWPFLRGLKH